jgi:hypothetical protein
VSISAGADGVWKLGPVGGACLDPSNPQHLSSFVRDRLPVCEAR